MGQRQAAALVEEGVDGAGEVAVEKRRSSCEIIPGDLAREWDIVTGSNSD
jgi:hypothetical protein